MVFTLLNNHLNSHNNLLKSSLFTSNSQPNADDAGEQQDDASNSVREGDEESEYLTHLQKEENEELARLTKIADIKGKFMEALTLGFEKGAFLDASSQPASYAEDDAYSDTAKIDFIRIERALGLLYELTDLMYFDDANAASSPLKDPLQTLAGFDLYYSLIQWSLEVVLKQTSMRTVHSYVDDRLFSSFDHTETTESSQMMDMDGKETPFSLLFLSYLLSHLPFAKRKSRWDLALLDLKLHLYFMENFELTNVDTSTFQSTLDNIILASEMFTADHIKEDLQFGLEELLEKVEVYANAILATHGAIGSGDMMEILEIWINVLFNSTVFLDLDFVKKIEQVLSRLQSEKSTSQTRSRLESTKFFILDEFLSSTSIYRMEDELDGRLVLEYFDGQRKKLKTGSLSLPAIRRVLQDRLEESDEDNNVQDVVVTGESIYEVIKDVLYCFLSSYSVYIPSGQGRKRKDRKDFPVASSCFIRIRFGGKDVQKDVMLHSKNGNDLMICDESQDISKLTSDDNLFDNLLERPASVPPVDQSVIQQRGSLEESSASSSAQVDSSREHGAENDGAEEKDIGNEGEEGNQVQFTVSKKRKKFEKSRTSSRLKDADAANADPVVGPNSAANVNGSCGPSVVSFEDLSSINDYLPSGLLPGLQVFFGASSIEFQDEELDRHELEPNSSRVECVELLARIQKSLLSPVMKQSASGSNNISVQTGKKKVASANPTGAGGEKGGLVDWLSSPPSGSLAPFSLSSTNEKTVNALYAKNPETLEEFKKTLFEKSGFDWQERVACADFVYLIVEYLISRLVCSAPLDTYMIRVLILSTQCLHKFAGIDLCKILEDRVYAAEAETDNGIRINKEKMRDGLLELMIVCEIFVDCLTDRNGSKALDEDEEITIIDPSSNNNSSATTKNALLSSTKARLFSSFFAALRRVSDWIGVANLDRDMLVRLFWVSVRASEVEGDAVGAVEALQSCLQVIEEMEKSSLDTDVCISIPHCSRDAIISRDAIQDKIEYFQLKVQIEETEDFYSEGELKLVVDRLEPLFLRSVSSRNGGQDRGIDIVRQMPPERRLEFLKLLRESSFSLGRFTTWLSTVVECISVTLGTMESGVLDFYDNLENLAIFMDDLNRFIDDHSHWRSFIVQMTEFTYLVLVCLQVCWVLVKFVKRMPKSSKAAYNRRMTLFRSFAARSWILFYHLAADKYKKDDEDEENTLSEILEWAHDQLGAVELCGGDDGAFLKLMVQHLAKAGPDYYPEIYQCYSCLYGTVIKLVSSPDPIDHQCTKTEFGKEAAEILFHFISPLLMEKVEVSQFRSITKDMTDCLLKVLEIFPSPPLDDRYITMNSAALERLLKMQINPVIAMPEQRQALAMIEIPEGHVSFSPICKKIYYLYGRIQLNNYYCKPDKDKSLDCLVSSVQHLFHHMLLSPFDLKGWVYLATAYSSTANEILGRGPLEYRDKRKVADAQRSAFHCYVRALKLYPAANLDEEDKQEMSSLLFNNFALHCQAIISAPAESIALKNDSMVKMFEMAGDAKSVPKESEYLAVMTKKLYGIVVLSLKNALHISPEWSYHLSLAHVYRKLGRNPDTVIHLYLRGILLMPSENITKDQDLALDPVYKCISYIIKSYFNSLLSEDASMQAYKDLMKLYPALEENCEKILAAGEEQVLLPDNTVYRQGVLLLHAIKRIDKKRWYHRPYFRIAWVWSKILREYSMAKEEMCLLLNIRTKFRRIWKTDLEANGRHFVYFTQYLSLMIEAAQKTCDIPLLVILCKRLMLEENMQSKMQVRNDARKALLQCIISLQDNPNDQSFRKLTETVPFIDPDVEKIMIDNYEAREENEMYRLVLVCDLKRARKQCEVALEKFILNLYSRLYLRALGDVTLKSNQVLPEKEAKMTGKVLQRAMHLTKNLSTKSGDAENPI